MSAAPALTALHDRVTAHLSTVCEALGHVVDELRLEWTAAEAKEYGLSDVDPAAQLRDLLIGNARRTGSRMTVLGWMAAAGHHSNLGSRDIVLAACAVELLHGSALVHDDVSGRSTSRVALIIGDLAHAEAQRLAGSLPTAMRCLWHQLVRELLVGQRARPCAIVRPLQLGATAATADPQVLAALYDYGRHASQAFALRQEMSDLYGDPDVTGPPNENELRPGKPTTLLALASERLRGPGATTLQHVRSADLTDDQFRQVREAMIDQGVVTAAESMITDNVDAALRALRTDTFCSDGIEQLTQAVDFVARRPR